MSRVVDYPAFQNASCRTCNLNTLCLPVSLDDDDIKLFDHIVQRRRPLARGTHLSRNGDPFRAIYIVRSGAIKNTMLTADGQEYVLGLYLAGEIIGLNAINYDSHPTTAVALDTTTVCEVPFERLQRLSHEMPVLQRELVKLISKELLVEQEMALAIAKRTAEERVAIALINLAERTQRDKGVATRFRLPMSRRDLSNYLGLAPETMSRLFKRFEAQGLIAVEERDIILRNIPELYDLAHRKLPDEIDQAHCGQV